MSFVDNPLSTEDWARPLANDRGLAGKIAAGIRKAILGGTINGGQKINEEEIAAAFATSRTPVREALRMLEPEGLVTVLPRRGVRVSPLVPDEAADTYICRAYLYGLAAKLSAHRRSGQDMAKLTDLMGELGAVAANSDRAAYLDVMARLNESIVVASQSVHIREMLRPLDLKAVRYRHLTIMLPRRMEQSRRNYQRIVDAIGRRKGNDAEAAIRHAIADAGEALLKHIGGGSAAKHLSIREFL
jgi:DNA-binding GntR family transcriptional regulator